MSVTFFCFCIVMGAVGGWLSDAATNPVPRQRVNFLTNVVMGIVGGLLGGFIIVITANATDIIATYAFGFFMATLVGTLVSCVANIYLYGWAMH